MFHPYFSDKKSTFPLTSTLANESCSFSVNGLKINIKSHLFKNLDGSLCKLLFTIDLKLASS